MDNKGYTILELVAAMLATTAVFGILFSVYRGTFVSPFFLSKFIIALT
jgi:hypothetical protein